MSRLVYYNGTWAEVSDEVLCRYNASGTNDDAYQPISWSGYTWNGNTQVNIVSNTNPAVAIAGGFRFRNIPVPQGGTIVSAYLKLYCNGNGAQDDLYSVIKGQDSDAADAFNVTTTLNPASRPRTVAEVAWNSPNSGTNVWVSSPDISLIIQEIIDRPGWVAFNPMVIIVEGNTSGGSYGTFNAEAYSNAGDNEPRLEITWKVS